MEHGIRIARLRGAQGGICAGCGFPVARGATSADRKGRRLHHSTTSFPAIRAAPALSTTALQSIVPATRSEPIIPPQDATASGRQSCTPGWGSPPDGR